ncbi:MAG: AZOBR_p60025 family cell surface glycopolymer formation protein [Thermodesulfobacteriota bacterium]
MTTLNYSHPSQYGFIKKSLFSVGCGKNFFILLLVITAFLSILYLYALKFDKNITGFMVIGDYFKAPQIWTKKTLIHQNSVGYDGQYYYYIAHDPFIQGGTYDHIDFPAYRYQRIVYPLAVWAFSLGRPGLIPWMMVAVNLAAVLLGVWVVLLMLREFGHSPWYTLLFAGFLGFLLCLLRSLPEPLAMAFILLAVFFHFKGKIVPQGLFLSLGALTQETTLLVSLAFFLYYLGKKDFLKSLFICLPPVVYFLWQVYIYSKFGLFSFIGGTQNFGLPFWGLVEKGVTLTRGGLHYEKIAEILYILSVGWIVLLAFFEIFRKITPLSLTLLGYAWMAVCFNHLIWVEPWSYARATLGLLTFNFLIFTKEGRRLNLVPMFLTPLIFLFYLLSMDLF